MINVGVPEHVIQRLFGHASADMTARYARLHDTTLRQAFDDYCQRRVKSWRSARLRCRRADRDAEWVKHHLGRSGEPAERLSGRPPQQDCPHPNACLTCPDFQTTPEFLAVHRQQAEHTRLLIATARERPVPLARQPSPGPRQPGAEHPRSGGDRGGRQCGLTTRRFFSGLPGLAGKQRLPAPKRHFGVSIATAARSLSRPWPTPPGVALVALSRRTTAHRDRAAALRDPGVDRRDPSPVDPACLSDSQQRRLEAATEEISRLRQENRQLHDELARALGQRRAAGGTMRSARVDDA